MKKIFLIVSILFFSVVLTGQSLREIVENYTIANKLDSISKLKTIKITRTLRMESSSIKKVFESKEEIFMKYPNKMLIISNISGECSYEAFDGANGYQKDKKGKTSELTAERIEILGNNNLFQNRLLEYVEDGKVLFEEDEIEKPVFKLTIAINEGFRKVLFIDKNSYFIIREVDYILDKKGKTMGVFYLTEFSEIKGLRLPMNQSFVFSGVEVKTTYSNVEIDFDTPMDDSIFVL